MVAPAGRIHLQEIAKMISQALGDLQHGADLRSARQCHIPASVDRSGDLIEVSPDCGELQDRLTER